MVVKITRFRASLLLFLALGIFPVLIPARALPLPLVLLKDRTLVVRDYVMGAPEFSGALAVIFGKANYTLAGLQIGDGGTPPFVVLYYTIGI